jgi:hypothetical protein
MPTLKNATDRKRIVERLYKLTSETQPLWGSFTSARMICHLSDGLAMALGDLPVKSVNMKMFQRFPLKHLILYVLPFPKGARTVPELLKTSPGSFTADRERLVEQIEQLALKHAGAGPEHPLFGWLTNHEWQVLQHKHIDHHLRQFGC